MGVALPGPHNLVGAAHVGAAELPQGLGREQRKCLAKQQQTHKRQREEEAFQDNRLFDHEITYALRARVTERQQKDAANGRKRITASQRTTTQAGSDGSTGAVVQVQGQEGMGGHREQGGRRFLQL